MRHALQCGVFDRSDRLPQIATDLLPARPKVALTWSDERALRQVGRAEGDVADELRLLIWRSRPPLVLDLLGELDRRDVVAGARGPATG